MGVASHEFMEFIRRRVTHMHPDHVLNMEKMPILFLFHSKCTWSEKGACTIHVLASTGETKRATLAATVTMGRELLPSLLIFKGNENGQIEKTSHIPTYGLLPSANEGMDEQIHDVHVD